MDLVNPRRRAIRGGMIQVSMSGLCQLLKVDPDCVVAVQWTGTELYLAIEGAEGLVIPPGCLFPLTRKVTAVTTTELEDRPY